MKIGTEDRKRLALLGVVGVGALGAVVYMYTEIFPSTPSAPPPPVANTVSGRALTPAISASNSSEKAPVSTAASLDPTLRMGPMLTTEALVYKGLGRNIFTGEAVVAPAPALPRPNASARPALTNVSAPSGPVGPPPIDLRFFGTATSSKTQPRAFLLHGEDVFLASVGDIVQRRYKILAISANSITIIDLANNNQQSLPLRLN